MPHDQAAGAKCALSMWNACETLDFLKSQSSQNLMEAEEGVQGTISGEIKAFLKAGIINLENSLKLANQDCGIDIPDSLIRKFAGSRLRDIPNLASELQLELRKALQFQSVESSNA